MGGIGDRGTRGPWRGLGATGIGDWKGDKEDKGDKGDISIQNSKFKIKNFLIFDLLPNAH
jgi:hypothetical protein